MSSQSPVDHRIHTKLALDKKTKYLQDVFTYSSAALIDLRYFDCANNFDLGGVTAPK